MKANKAFTMLELMVAAAVVLITVVGVLYSLISAQLLNESNANLVAAASDAQTVLEDIKAIPYSQIGIYAAPTFTNLTGETVSLSRSTAAKFTSVNVTISWNERGRARVYVLKTRIAK